MKQIKEFLIPLSVAVVGLLAGSFLAGGTRSTVSWQDLRAVAIESDDWGLAGFVPDAEAWEGLDRDQLGTGRFPEVYWLSTLEDSSMVGRLNDVLARHSGRDGHPAVLQPNYVMSSLSYTPGRWDRYDLPALPPRYGRPGLWNAVRAGMDQGTWYPEFHAAWHYDPDLRKRDAVGNEFASEVTARGIMLFPGSESARELGAWRSTEELALELDHSLAVFQQIFGRSAASIMAPDYHWDDRVEKLWSSRGLRVIQGKREQVNPAWGAGIMGRLVKYAMRHWARVRHPGRVYLERNCRLEPVQTVDPAGVAADCAQETRRAWSQGQPAIVESHRINFAHTDHAVVAAGLGALDQYLADITGGSDGQPVFLTDHEIAQLATRGTSWCVRGGVVIVRNATRGRKVVGVPADAWNRAASVAGRPVAPGDGVLVNLAGGTAIDLVP